MAMVMVLLITRFIGQFDFFVVNMAAPRCARPRGRRRRARDGRRRLCLRVRRRLIAGGRLGDVYGRRRMYVLGIFGFAATSLLCGVTSNATELVVARMAPGLTAAITLRRCSA